MISSRATAEPVVQRRNPWRRRLILLGQIAPMALLLSVWQFGSGKIVDPLLFGTPTAAVERLFRLIQSRQFYDDFSTTLTEIILGYVIGVVAGVVLALFAWRWDAFNQIVEPYIITLNAIPKVALAPLFILWFGLGIWSKVITAMVLVFFLVFYAVYLGLRSLDYELIDLARIMGCNERQVSRDVLFPATLPFLISGLRTAMPYAIIGVVIGEFAASAKGVGYRVLYSAATFDPAGVYAHIIVLVLLVLGVNGLLSWLEARLIRWRPQQEQAGAY